MSNYPTVTIEEVIKCRKVVSQIRSWKLKDGDDSLKIVQRVYSLYKKEGVKPLFPVNLSVKPFFSHCTPIKGDKIKGVTILDQGFNYKGVNIDCAYTYNLSEEDELYYLSMREKYKQFISLLRFKLSKSENYNNKNLSELFDEVFSEHRSSIAKNLMGHRIGKRKLHMEPYLQPGLSSIYCCPTKKIKRDNIYAIEFYFVRGLLGEIEEVEDDLRSISYLKGKYIRSIDLDNEIPDQVFYPLKTDKELFQIQETFYLNKEGGLVCLSSDL
jgi:methionine aminopeptidase